MKKVYIIYTVFILAIFFSTIALGQVTVFEDNFDSYTAGQQLSCQAPTIWKTWTNTPCNATEDAYVSNALSFSGGNALKIIQSNDIVREIGAPITAGIAEINFQVFIPSGKSGYFNTLADFNPPTYAWAMQVFFNAAGTGTIDAGAVSSATFSYPQNQWFPVKIVADLTADSGKFFLNGNLIRRWRWTAGTFGSAIAKQLDGNDFYGYVATDNMFIDDYNIVQISSAANKIISTTTGGNWNDGTTWVGGIVPPQDRVAEILTGAVVTLTSSITDRNNNTIVNGTLICGNNSIGGSGHFLLGGGATLQIGSQDGISLSGSTGNIKVTGTRTFSSYANYIYNGATSQVTGNGLPSSVKSLTIINNQGVSISSNTTVNSSLSLIAGVLNSGPYILKVGTSVTNTGIINYSSGKVLGKLNRWLSGTNSFLFPVGPTVSDYTPVILSNIVGSGTFSVNAVDGIHPNALGNEFLQMYWTLTSGGITSADVEFHYLDSDVAGDEGSYELYRYDGAMLPYSPFNLNTTTNIASVTGINSFSDWTLGFDNPLPVELTTFTANVIGKNVKLIWKTITEVNNYGFDIERKSWDSYNSENGSYKKIGFVEGHGNTNSPKDYSFIDDHTSSGKYAYRLKQMDNDGKINYSKDVEVEIKLPNEFILDQNFPNPFNPTTKIGFSIPQAGNVKLTVYNLLGQEMGIIINEQIEAGYHYIDFNAVNLNSGVYIYKIEAGNFIQAKKMTFIK